MTDSLEEANEQPEASWDNLDDNEDLVAEDTDEENIRVLAQEVHAIIPSFTTDKYESPEMHALINLNIADEKIPQGVHEMDSIIYKDSQVFPSWMLTSSAWSKNKIVQTGNVISDILKIPANIRSPEQVSNCIHWLMSRWKIAETMGFKRCASMFKEFKYVVAQSGETIVQQGEVGMKFYIIVSGEAAVHKAGLGAVGKMGKGTGFGEVALTMGHDLRTATVTALETTELLSLHKNDYDFYVRDLQMVEKKENFALLSQCELFSSWPKAKVDRMSNSAVRHVYDAGSYIFHQGDVPDALYIVFEGSVNIIKEIVVFCKNKWPVSTKKWAERHSTVKKPMSLRHIQKGQFFGEIGILQNCLRTSSAMATVRTVLICIDKVEFLHLVSYGGASVYNTCEADTLMGVVDSMSKSYIGDTEIMDVYGENSHIRGGPNSIATVGTFHMKKSKLEKHIYEKKLQRYNFTKAPLALDKTKDGKASQDDENKSGSDINSIVKEVKDQVAQSRALEKLRKENQPQMTAEMKPFSQKSKSKINVCRSTIGFASKDSLKTATQYDVTLLPRSLSQLTPGESSTLLNSVLAPPSASPKPFMNTMSNTAMMSAADDSKVDQFTKSLQSVAEKSPLVIGEQTVVLRKNSSLRLEELRKSNIAPTKHRPHTANDMHTPNSTMIKDLSNLLAGSSHLPPRSSTAPLMLPDTDIRKASTQPSSSQHRGASDRLPVTTSDYMPSFENLFSNDGSGRSSWRDRNEDNTIAAVDGTSATNSGGDNVLMTITTLTAGNDYQVDLDPYSEDAPIPVRERRTNTAPSLESPVDTPVRSIHPNQPLPWLHDAIPRPKTTGSALPGRIPDPNDLTMLDGLNIGAKQIRRIGYPVFAKKPPKLASKLGLNALRYPSYPHSRPSTPDALLAGSLTTQQSALKILNKKKVSYRDVMGRES